MALIVLHQAAAGQTILFVDADAPPEGDGSSWATPFSDLQDALDVAATISGPREIWVAAGTYTPDRGTGDRTMTFQIPGDVQLLGGFSGGEQFPEERDPVANPTILSGDLADNDGPDFDGFEENSHVIITAQSLLIGSVIDGFTIRGANNELKIARGGGIHLNIGDLTVRNTILIDNRTTGSAGAIFAFGPGHLAIENCVIQKSLAESGFAAGAVFLGNAISATFTDTTFTDNRTAPGPSVNPGCGGAVACLDADLIIFERCVFEDNESGCGGAINAVLTTELRFFDCDFIENHCTNLFGGAMRMDRSDNSPLDDKPTIIDGCRFIGNAGPSLSGGAIEASENVMRITNTKFIANLTGGFSDAFGAFIGAGAVHLNRDTGHHIENCLFASNVGGEFAGIALFNQALAGIINCTFADNLNQTDLGGAGVFTSEGSNAVIRNAIFQNNSRTVGGELVQDEFAQIFFFGPLSTVNHSLVQGLSSLSGAGLISGDPIFVDSAGTDGAPATADDNYALGAGSPAIDAGDNFSVSSDTALDLVGNPRFIDDPAIADTGLGRAPIVDMGAYEFQPKDPIPGDITGEGLVNGIDLGVLLANWSIPAGASGCGGEVPCPADINQDGVVDGIDLGILLANWTL